jgi:hypothetical protein
VPILDDKNLEMFTFGALKCALIVIRPIVQLNSNNPHWPFAPRACWSVDGRW